MSLAPLCIDILARWPLLRRTTTCIPLIAVLILFGCGNNSCSAQCDSPLHGGLIGNTQSSCMTFDPGIVSSISVAGSDTVAVEYAWLVQIPDDGPQWDTIQGAFNQSLTTGQIDETHYYQRIARVDGCTEWHGQSNTVCMEVLPSVQINSYTSLPVSCSASCDGSIVFEFEGDPSDFNVLVNGQGPGQISFDGNGTCQIDDICVGWNTVDIEHTSGCTTSFTVDVGTLCAANAVTITFQPPDLVLECSDVVPMIIPLFSDPCDANLTIAFSENTVLTTCGYQIKRNWLATDFCGAFANASQIIDVLDSTPPTIFSSPVDVVLECGDPLPTEIPIFIDNCDADLTTTYSENSLPFVCGYFLERIWTATDDCGNTTSAAQVITIIDSVAPVVLFALADVVIECGDAPPSDIPVFSDACDPSPVITFSEITLPSSCGYQIQRTWTATDACGHSTSVVWTIDVVDSTPPLVVYAPLAVVIECGNAPPSDVPIFSDACDPSPVITFSEITLPSSCGYQIQRTWTATDACGHSTSVVWTIDVVDSTPPLVVYAPSDLVIECGDAPPFDLPIFSDTCDPDAVVAFSENTIPSSCGYQIQRTWTATDACGHSTSVIWTIDVVDSTPPLVVYAPSDLVIECGDALPFDLPIFSDTCDPDPVVAFSENTIPSSCGYQIQRTWTATDACGHSTSAIWTIDVVDSTPPQVVYAPSDLVIECGNALPSDTPIFSDVCDPDPVVSLSENTIPSTCGYQIQRTWTATDACGHSTSVIWIIDVVDSTPPLVVYTPSDVAIECGNALPSDVPIFNDACDTSPVITFSETTLPYSCGYQIQRTWTATDACGHSTSLTQIVDLVDSTPPIVVYTPSDVVNECGDALPSDTPIFSDVCDPDPVVSLSENTIPSSCGYQIQKTWTATDACGHSISTTQIIDLIDSTPPAVNYAPSDVVIECGDALPSDVPLFSDDCDPNPVVVFSESTIPSSCGYQIQKTWTASDACGHATSTVWIIDVVDSTPPLLLYSPSDVVIECGDALPSDIPIFSDACDPDPLVVFSESTIPSLCGYQIQRTWIATDACGHSTSTVWTMDVVDSTPPTIDYAPADIAIQCSDGIPMDEPIFSDLCDNDLQITFSETLLPQACGYIIQRSWTASDDCGNSTTFVRNILLTDNNPPTFTYVPADVTISCDAAVPTDIPSISDACDPNPTSSYSETTNTTPCGYQILRTWLAIDACGNTSSVVWTIDVVDSTPPVVLFVPADVVIECGDALPSDVPVFIDACDPDPVVTFSENTIPSSCGHQVERTWTATDACGHATSITQIIDLVDSTPPAVSYTPPDAVMECGDAMPSDVPLFSDACDPDPVVSLSENTIPSSCGYQIQRTWTATDACGHSTSIIQIIDLIDSTPPAVNYAPSDVVIECGDALPSDIPIFSDTCDPYPVVVFSENTIPNSCGYQIQRTWTATDACGHTSSIDWTIDVIDSTPPLVVYSPSDVVIECGDALPSDVPIFSDACDPDPLIAFSESSTSSPCGYQIQRTWTATDACGHASSTVWTIDVVDSTPPLVVYLPSDVVIECGDALPVDAPLFSDICDPDPLVVFSENSTSSTCGFQIQRTWTATDACGHATSIVWTIDVVDTTPPLVAYIPSDAVIECGDILPSDIPIFSDDCDPDPVVVLSENTIPSSCGYQIQRTWTATDACGHATSTMQTIDLVDTTPPTVNYIPSDAVIECGDALPSDVPIFSDICDPDLVVQLSENTIPSSCGYQIQRTWTATDACGHATSITQIIDLVDTTPPAVSYTPSDVVIECGDTLPSEVPLFNDACDPDPVVVFSETMIPSPCGYQIQRTWTATDACGHSTSLTQIVDIVDSTPPLVVYTPPDEVIECGNAPPSDAPIFSDACDPDPLVVFSESTIPFLCGYQIQRTWTATDACGHTSSTAWTIDVIDSTPPTIDYAPADITIQCSEGIPVDEPVFSDLCDNDLQINFSETLLSQTCGYIIQRTWTASDDCGNSTTFDWNILLTDNNPPTFTYVPADLIVSCGEDSPSLTGIAEATDNCTSSVNVLITDLISDLACGHLITRTFIATDDCGNIASATQTIEVTDTMAPIVDVDATVYTTCDNIPAVVQPTVTDNCDDDVSVTYSEFTDGACPYTIHRIWTAADACENTSTAEQLIVVSDVQAPSFDLMPVYTEFECDAVDTYLPEINDNCDATAWVHTINEAYIPGDCLGMLQRTYEATDVCGNTSTAVQIIQLTDVVAPQFLSVPPDTVIMCGAPVPLAVIPTYSDNCTGEPFISFQETYSSSSCPVVINRTWTVTDDCENGSSYTQIIRLQQDTLIDIHVYPSPVHDHATIALTCPQGAMITMAVYDMQGKCLTPLLHGETIESSYLFNLDVTGWSEGIYVVQVTGDESIYMERFIVEQMP